MSKLFDKLFEKLFLACAFVCTLAFTVLLCAASFGIVSQVIHEQYVQCNAKEVK